MTSEKKFGLEGLETKFSKFRDHDCQTEHDKPGFIVPDDHFVSAMIRDIRSFCNGYRYESSRNQGNEKFRAHQDQSCDNPSHYGVHTLLYAAAALLKLAQSY